MVCGVDKKPAGLVAFPSEVIENLHIRLDGVLKGQYLLDRTFHSTSRTVLFHILSGLQSEATLLLLAVLQRQQMYPQRKLRMRWILLSLTTPERSPSPGIQPG